MARAPILPRNPADPTGVDGLERGAINEFRKKMRLIRAEYLRVLDTLPATPITVNRRYTYDLDAFMLSTIFDSMGTYIEEILIGRSMQENWFLNMYVTPAYGRGTNQARVNLSQQSEVYKAAVPNQSSITRSLVYMRRVGMVQARAFEEMQGLSEETRTRLNRVLAEGIARGENPRDIGRRITDATGIQQRRAATIARTEVTTALRRARWDEADEAEDRFGIVSKEMHLSALSPTTRATHAARHGNLYTTDQVRAWYAEDGNAINCKCSQTSVLVDENGDPLVPSIVQRAKKMRATAEQRRKAEEAVQA